MLEQLKNKLELGGRFNQWIYFPEFHLNLYYRITRRLIDGSVVDTLDLATIEVDDGFRGKGFFAAFLDDVEILADKYSKTIFVESILNENLYIYLMRRGYYSRGFESDRCLYRKTMGIVA